jgi:hypothetical protein
MEQWNSVKKPPRNESFTLRKKGKNGGGGLLENGGIFLRQNAYDGP